MKSSANIKSTTNYKMFGFLADYPPASDPRIRSLMRAMQREQKMHRYPIVVHKGPRGNLVINDGRKRFAAAKELGFPIFYIVAKPQGFQETLLDHREHDLFGLKRLLDHFVLRRNPNYEKLDRFLEHYKLPLTTCIWLFGSTIPHFKDGKFSLKNEEFARRVARVVYRLRQLLGFTPDRTLIEAVLRTMREFHGFDPDRFLGKLEKHPEMFTRRSSWQDYVSVIEEVYNKGHGDKAFFGSRVKEAALTPARKAA